MEVGNCSNKNNSKINNKNNNNNSHENNSDMEETILSVDITARSMGFKNVPQRSEPNNDQKDSSSPSNTKYPVGVYFCMIGEATERFANYVVLTVLTFFLRDRYSMNDSTATLIFHAFVCLSYSTPILGSVLSDSSFGAYSVVLYSSIIYSLGLGFSAFGALTTINVQNDIAYDSNNWTTTIEQLLKITGLIGLILTALACGARKPCSAAFAADQFTDNNYNRQRRFFSYFYLAMSVGMVTAQLATPTLRVGFGCAGQSDTCYPLAFGVAAAVMFFSTLTFLSGTPRYVRNFKKSDVILKTARCIWFGLKSTVFSHPGGRNEKIMKNHSNNSGKRQRNGFEKQRKNDRSIRKFLRRATSKYGFHFVSEVDRVLDISVLFVPGILFWALYDQMFSTWLIQTDFMDSRWGSFNIPPDQLAVVFSLMVILTIPMMDHVIYPVFYRCHFLHTSLQKMGLGLLLAALSFGVAGFLQVQINRTIYDNYSPNAEFESEYNNNWTRIEKTGLNGSFPLEFDVKHKAKLPFTITIRKNVVQSTAPDNNADDDDNYDDVIDGGRKNLHEFSVSWRSRPINIDDRNEAIIPTTTVTSYFSITKIKTGYARFYVVLHPTLFEKFAKFTLILHQNDSSPQSEIPIKRNNNGENGHALRLPMFNHKFFDVKLQTCKKLDNSSCVFKFMGTYTAENGASDALLVDEDFNLFIVNLLAKHEVHLLWQLPQYILMASAEATFCVAGMEFAYSQASASMKSVMQAVYLVTSVFGNILAMITSGTRMFPDPTVEFFTYAFVMLLFLVYFVSTSRKYKYKSNEDEKVEDIIKKSDAGNNHCYHHCNDDDATSNGNCKNSPKANGVAIDEDKEENVDSVVYSL